MGRKKEEIEEKGASRAKQLKGLNPRRRVSGEEIGKSEKRRRTVNPQSADHEPQNQQYVNSKYRRHKQNKKNNTIYARNTKT